MVVTASVGPVSVPDVLVILLFSVASLLSVRVMRATWRQDSSTGVDLEWLQSRRAWLRRAQQRSGPLFGGLALTVLIAFIAVTLFPDEKANSGVGLVVVTVCIVPLLLNFLLLTTSVLVGRPKFLIPPAFRGQGGFIQDVWRWIRGRTSQV